MSSYVLNKQIAEVAQSVEQGTENPRVSGSIPFLGISFYCTPVFLKLSCPTIEKMLVSKTY
jgi:hypothetical protein